MAINDIQKNIDGTMFITASKDCTAKLFDVDDLSLLKTYTTERPVNSAAVSPIYDHVSIWISLRKYLGEGVALLNLFEVL